MIKQKDYSVIPPRSGKRNKKILRYKIDNNGQDIIDYSKTRIEHLLSYYGNPITKRELDNIKISTNNQTFYITNSSRNRSSRRSM